MTTEFEIKFLNINEASLHDTFRSLHATLINPKHLMKRKTFEFPKSLAVKDKWARVRDEGDKVTMSIKQVTDPSSIDGTKEVELTVNDFSQAVSFLENIGLVVKSYQENYRETWQYKGCIITIDIWPGLKPFVEIEGSNESSVTATAQELGFDIQTGVYGSIDMIYAHIYDISRDVVNHAPMLTFDTMPKELTAV